MMQSLLNRIKLDAKSFAERINAEWATFDGSPKDCLSVPQVRWLDLAQQYLKLVNKDGRA